MQRDKGEAWEGDTPFWVMPQQPAFNRASPPDGNSAVGSTTFHSPTSEHRRFYRDIFDHSYPLCLLGSFSPPLPLYLLESAASQPSGFEALAIPYVSPHKSNLPWGTQKKRYLSCMMDLCLLPALRQTGDFSPYPFLQFSTSVVNTIVPAYRLPLC